jgi:hypothetical protein
MPLVTAPSSKENKERFFSNVKLPNRSFGSILCRTHKHLRPKRSQISDIPNTATITGAFMDGEIYYPIID